jgi:NAD(P)-dependent dehydrogenase (short-subunit alcohol dehydrogenase family)
MYKRSKARSPSYIRISPLRVVVVFGGTSGIGRATAARLANQLHGCVHLVVVARNKVAAEKFFATLPAPADVDSPSSYYILEFVYCDLLSMASMHTTCKELVARYPKINYLVLTSGRATFSWVPEMTVDNI